MMTSFTYNHQNPHVSVMLSSVNYSYCLKTSVELRNFNKKEKAK